MQSISATPWQTCYYPIPNHVIARYNLQFPCSSHQHFPKTHLIFKSLSTLSATRSCSNEQDQEKRYLKHLENPPEKDPTLLQDFYSSVQTRESQLEEYIETPQNNLITRLDNSTNMWWTDLKAALGQRINLEGITCSIGILVKDRQLVLPHVSVRDIRSIDWAELKSMGFEGVVFDKDNTITVPYSLSLWPPLESSIEECKFLFGSNIAVFSNSAGLYEYDPTGKEARALEKATGIKVLRHRAKKPAGTAEEVERDFGCESSRLVMVGDRPFTDIVYGNRNGFLTILTKPLSEAEEPFIVRQVRKFELAMVRRWLRKGIKPCSHGLLPCPQQCVKDQDQ